MTILHSLKSASAAKKQAPLFKPTLLWMLSKPTYCFAFGFGTGLLKAPGTWGSLVPIPYFILFTLLELPLWSGWLIALFLFLSGIWICERTGKTLGVADYGGIVWDEIAAFFALLLCIPPQTSNTGWLIHGGILFALFRFFDIVKPQPIKYIDQHIKGGLGVMVDDVIAAVFAAGVYFVGLAIYSKFFAAIGR
jgi:phosphatidylglycerophosphatase A